MADVSSSLIGRNDTIFGVCEAIGEDLGFHANYLRVALGVMVLWNPVAMIVAYAALGVLVIVSRLLFPTRAAAATPVEPEAPCAANDAQVAPSALAG